MTTVDDIDALLAAPKRLAGSPQWADDQRGAVVRLVAPVALQGVVGALSLRASATRFTVPQRGSATLLYEGRPLQRISIRPDHAHVNPFGPTVPIAYRGLRLMAGASRLHLWSLNRVWPRQLNDNVVVAQRLDPEPSSLHEGFAWFLIVCGIEGDVPTPPWEPRFL